MTGEEAKKLLVEGNTYTFTRLCEEIGRGEKKSRPERQKQRLRLIKKYTHHAQFENAFGIRRSYIYFDIGKLLSGEGMEY